MSAYEITMTGLGTIVVLYALAFAYFMGWQSGWKEAWDKAREIWSPKK